MSSYAGGLARGTVGAARLGALLVGAAAVGGLASVQPALAATLVLAIALALLVANDVRLLPAILIFTMFVESLALGPGLRVGRVAGALALAVIAYVLLTRGSQGLRPNGLLAAVAAYGLWTLASAFWAEDTGPVTTALFSYLLALAYMLSFAFLVRGTRQLKQIFATLAFGSLVFGLVSFATYSAGAADDRAAGLQGDPNYFAVYQVIALPAALVVAALTSRPQVRLALYGVVGVIVLSVVSSLSRTGLIALTGVVLATLLLPWRAFFRRPSQKLSYAISLVIASAAAAALGATALISRIQALLEPGEESDRGSGRSDLWRAAWRGFHENEVLGLGAGNFRTRSLDLLQSTPGVDTTKNYVRAGREAHNAYLGTLTELGVVGLALFLLVIGLTGTYLIRSAKRSRRAGRTDLERFSFAVLVSLFGFLLSAFFLSNELGKPLWIIAGLALALDVITRPPPGATAGEDGQVGVEDPEYDLDVRERLVEQLEQRVTERMDALFVEHERLERRRAALVAREEELRSRERQLGSAAAPAPAVTEAATRLEERAPEVEARERALQAQVEQLQAEVEKLQAEVEKLQAEIEKLQAEAAQVPVDLGPDPAVAADIAERQQSLARLETRLSARVTELAAAEERHAERVRAVAQRELALARAAARAAVAPPAAERPAPPPRAPDAPAEAAAAPADDVALWTLPELERLVDEQAESEPERVDEWRYTLLYLREHADASGRLASSFDGLLADVFGDLVARSKHA